MYLVYQSITPIQQKIIYAAEIKSYKSIKC